MYKRQALNPMGSIQQIEPIRRSTAVYEPPEVVEVVFQKYDFDYVINFAAESHVDRSIKNPEIFVQSNVMGTVNLLQLSLIHI